MEGTGVPEYRDKTLSLHREREDPYRPGAGGGETSEKLPGEAGFHPGPSGPRSRCNGSVPYTVRPGHFLSGIPARMGE